MSHKKKHPTLRLVLPNRIPTRKPTPSFTRKHKSLARAEGLPRTWKHKEKSDGWSD